MRKLATAAAVSLALASGGVKALGLGDIEMRSALNQPMNAEIRLTSVSPGEADGMIVKLASAEAFSRAGIERTAALQNLQFSVDAASANPVIRITSRAPIVEPFLNFLLEVDWPSGRMVREYTVLLDPPVFLTPNASARSTASDQPAFVSSEPTLIAPTPIDRTVGESFDFDVEIVGSSDEVANNAVLSAETFIEPATPVVGDIGNLDGGEIVSLDELASLDSIATDVTSVATADSFGGSEVLLDNIGDVGEVVVLSDLEAGNPVALDQFQTAQADNFEFNVEIVGESVEVADSYVAPGSGAFDSQSSFGNGSEIVSLDSLDSSGGTGGGEVVVQRGETLFEIANDNAVAGVSAQQMMMALLNANQSAFINGNVNLVKSGAILRIPDAGEINQISQAQAVAQMSEQNQLWQQYRDNTRRSSGTQVASAPRAPTPTANDNDAAGDVDADSVAAEAQRILDSALSEIQGRDELQIVADNDSTSRVASSTADTAQTDEESRIRDLDRRIQLAKEELASTRLESADLDDQSSELRSTSENLESLVSIRQQEVARLQDQLRQATEDSDAAGESLASTVQSGVDAASDGANDLVAGAGDAAGSTRNALTDAGTELAEVELLSDNVANSQGTEQATEQAAQQTTAAIAPPEKQAPWYAELLEKYGKWLVIGIGALSALAAAWLLFFKRRRKDEDHLEFDEDEVDLFDDEVDLQAEMDAQDEPAGIGSAVAAGAGGAAAVAAGAGAAAAGAFSADDEDEHLLDDGPGEETQAVHAAIDDDIDHDDTISEVDVYLAYGLHGQAEELLSKAIERDPGNAEYAFKLLQTHHAQGNTDGFSQAATDYHERFGGNESPEWDSISEMGHDLAPKNALFAGSAETIESLGKGDLNAPKLSDNDFLDTVGDSPNAAESISRDFSEGVASSAGADSEDESDLMDQSLDPAFAFDETDLEATGDFSQIANELAGEEATDLDLPEFDAAVPAIAQDAETLDFPGFDADGPVEKLGDVAASAGVGIKGAAAGIAGGAAALAGGIGAKAVAAKDKAADAMDSTMNFDDFELPGSDQAANEVSGAADSVADELTLDLDQLSGDLELDSADFMGSSAAAADSLEIPDLTSDNDLLAAGAAPGESSDEMDTMMDLAKAYIDMGDKDSASSALGEIVKSGNPAQVSEAETLLRKIS